LPSGEAHGLGMWALTAFLGVLSVAVFLVWRIRGRRHDDEVVQGGRSRRSEDALFAAATASLSYWAVVFVPPLTTFLSFDTKFLGFFALIGVVVALVPLRDRLIPRGE